MRKKRASLLLHEDHSGRARAQKEIDEQAALEVGMHEKAKEFIEKGAEVYAKA